MVKGKLKADTRILGTGTNMVAGDGGHLHLRGEVLEVPASLADLVNIDAPPEPPAFVATAQNEGIHPMDVTRPIASPIASAEPEDKQTRPGRRGRPRKLAPKGG